MAGTKAGGQKAAARNIEKYGADFYSIIGAEGGKNSGTGGFYYAKLHKTEDDPAHPKNAGNKGGHLSKRGKALV